MAMLEGNSDFGCPHCGYWVKHAPNCSAPKAKTPNIFEEQVIGVKQPVVVKPLVPKKEPATSETIFVAPIDPEAEISVELVDKRHIVIRRCSRICGMHSVNLHYPHEDAAQVYIQGVILLAKQVGAEIINEGTNAYCFKGLAGKLIIRDPSFGTKVL